MYGKFFSAISIIQKEIILNFFFLFSSTDLFYRLARDSYCIYKQQTLNYIANEMLSLSMLTHIAVDLALGYDCIMRLSKDMIISIIMVVDVEVSNA